MDLQELESKYVCIRADIYNRLINYLANEFAYAKIFQPIEDLKLNAFEVTQEVLIAYDPSIQKNEVVKTLETLLKERGATGVEDALEADRISRENGQQS